MMTRVCEHVSDHMCLCVSHEHVYVCVRVFP